MPDAAPTHSTAHYIPLQPVLVRLRRETPEREDALWAALEARTVRNNLDMGGHYIPLPLPGGVPGFPRDPIDGRPMLTGVLWGFVDRVRGAFEHPVGVPRPIEVCEEDVQVWERTWSRQKPLPTPEREVVEGWDKAVTCLVQKLGEADALVRKSEFEDACTHKLQGCTVKDARKLYDRHIRPAGLGVSVGAQSTEKGEKLTRGKTSLNDWAPRS